MMTSPATSLRLACAVLVVWLCGPILHAQILLADDFGAGVIDPTRWSVVTTGIPQGGASVTVQNGQCALQNRGHLVSNQTFDAAAIGPYRVRCTFRWTDAYDRFQLLLRSNGVPSGTYGETEHGIQLAAEMEGGSGAGIGSRSNLIVLGPQSVAGPGITFAVGVTYTAELADLGWGFRGRIEGPGDEWWEFERPVTTSISPHQRLVVHNRENTVGTHLCWLDDLVAESMIQASYTPFGAPCAGPTGNPPSLAAIGTPRIGGTSHLRVSNLPPNLSIALYAFGFSNAWDSGPFGPYPLPADLSVFGWIGCQQLVSLEIMEWDITASGSVDHPLVLPYEPSWVGIPFYVQALAFYSTVEGVATTRGIAGVIGY